MNILQIKSSLNGKKSSSTKLSDVIVEEIRKKYPTGILTVRDLAIDILPHFSDQHFGAFSNSQEIDALIKEDIIKISDKLIDEIQQADFIVIAVPIYNLTIPSILKSWIDLIVRAQKTFRYTAEGPVGLLSGKKVYLSISSGGIYSQGPRKSHDFTEPYLKTILGFIGLSDITTFRVEGLSIPGISETAFSNAVQSIHIS
ncbi:FMN-dependent NADH-azoreductase [Flavobacterium ajazii]|uniref:FMN-dependent NADH-azoreductase n=1 Tax=Flavobacterium ajazii TaxID=2692318 RepID=UPI0013D8B8C2|nr:NAD(P)H-dependent oxidoreductase [Flavobacterium ajazii]